MGWARGARAAFAAGVALLAGAAGAHEFECEKRVNGVRYLRITQYPAELTWTMRITNSHATDVSVVQRLADPLLEGVGFEFVPGTVPPLSLAPGASQVWTFPQTLSTKDDCDALAGVDGRVDDRIDNVFTVGWDVAEAQCRARVVCDENPNPPPPPPNGTATRTLGFFKTHLVPLQACLDVNEINLGPGFGVIDTMEEALGVLWGNPSRLGDGTRRDEVERARFLLARQTLVGVCNVRLFGTQPTPVTLISDALFQLQSNDCGELLALAEAMDDFNNSGTNSDFPAGFVSGPATPQQARDLAVDPSLNTPDVCER